MKIKELFLALFIISFANITNANAQSNLTENKDINSLIAKKREYNKSVGYGYRIQLYNGTEKRAKSLRNRFQLTFPDTYTKLKYDAPEWKIHVGNYKTRLEADKALHKIQESFSGAIVINL
ncbi:SPOR domain-containing protein [Tenacibaculum maritimum]|uniref:SPOR domain-containing protein n=1 Tax=Tenacibaculum maritimum NCIMB 2154 TaxID=1349785 RepID=A0A2H1ECX8_9FLAO|nr:SPOR domain-containing protein [Tenacibaculum maritimum]MCD9562315.1 SPOR domain-containing protein [Tenacibaculum maritimum]MCD9565786.1 SPOR domain-containing protein [Tenacibaculum maritimum]MCD9578015.1 SPOR domain-containing protein [Tenacibaculum maritimum]MCD9585041.1 SPOR domain-containing protein [Tenacibaculum maritimum]MCD9597522.1 SPOR domain-containing protein [Tenacibaculum maritimum]